jgi:SNF2 family DNA or RNA helicase
MKDNIIKSYRTQPYKHQIESFEFSKHKNVFALFAEQGTGKTKMSIMKIDYLQSIKAIDKVIVICPLAVKDVWIEQLAEHAQFEYSYFVYDDRVNTTKKRAVEYKTFCESPGLKVLIIHYEAFITTKINSIIVQFSKSGYLDMFVILDESTKIKEMTAKRTKKIIKGFSNRKYKAILTGTPTPNSPIDLYAQFEFLQPGFFGMSLFHFKHHYTIMVNIKSQDGRHANILLTEKYYSIIKYKINKIQNEHGITGNGLSDNEILLRFEGLSYKYGISLKDIFYIRNQPVFCPYKNMDELNNKISKITYKVMKKDCLDLPEKIYEKLIVEMSGEQKRVIAELKKQYQTEYAGRQLTISNMLTLIGRLQIITGGNFPCMEDNSKYTTKPMKDNPKLKALMEDIDTVSEDTKIIIWAIFTSELQTIYNALCEKYFCRLYYGNTTKEERTEIKNDFMAGKFRILIINPSVGGLGLNFQISTLHYFFSNSYKADDRLQAEDRSHRIGQKNNVVYKDIIIKDSIDEKVYAAIRRKEDVINFFRDKKMEVMF